VPLPVDLDRAKAGPDEMPNLPRGHDVGGDGGGAIAAFGRTRLGVWAIKHLVSPLQRRLYWATGGRLSLTGSKPVLLLTTTGRRSGKERTTPVFYLRDGDRIVVCNVRPGFERPNPWPRNLRVTPLARIRIGGETIRCRSHEAGEREVQLYWPRLVEMWPAYQAFFEQSGERSIFVLEPLAEAK
jgi:F420H(2)-dependent quinone reductase